MVGCDLRVAPGRAGLRRHVRVALCAGALSIAPLASAQSTAGFPVEPAPAQAAPAPPRPSPPPAPPGYAPPGYAPPGYAPPAYAPGYVPPPYAGPRPSGPSTVPGYGVVYPSPYGAGYQGAPVAAPPREPPNPLLDEQLRYRQVLGAYYRTPSTASGADTGAKPAGYVRVAERSRHRHDGLYLRLAGGVGSAHDSMSSNHALPTTRPLSFEPDKLVGSGSATAAVTELAVGFTPGAGFVLGVGSYTATLSGLVAEVRDQRTGSYDFRVSQLAVIGPFADWYLDPTSGFHVQVSPGVATYVAGAGEPRTEGPQAQAHTGLGFGLMVGAGYEWWIGDQWSFGFLGRFMYGSTSGTDDRRVGWTHSSYAPAALLSATYH